MQKKKYRKESLMDSFAQIVDLAKKTEEIKIGQILALLPQESIAAFLVIFSTPFCLPIQIPGLSTPFGLLLGFLGLQIAFAKRPWWPKWVLEKNVKSQSVERVIIKTKSALEWIQKVLHPRLLTLTQNQFFIQLNGLLIFLLSLILFLPLPIPMTNMLSAIPIFCFGLGHLEKDGLLILLGYFFVLICSLFIFGIIHVTKAFFI